MIDILFVIFPDKGYRTVDRQRSPCTFLPSVVVPLCALGLLIWGHFCCCGWFHFLWYIIQFM